MILLNWSSRSSVSTDPVNGFVEHESKPAIKPSPSLVIAAALTEDPSAYVGLFVAIPLIFETSWRLTIHSATLPAHIFPTVSRWRYLAVG